MTNLKFRIKNWKLRIKSWKLKIKKGNISILVIFVLLASGVIGVLTMHFVGQMLSYRGAVQSYYQSYYLARAWLELSLTQAQTRGVGFEYQVQSGDAIVKNNFWCWPECDFETEIFAQSAYYHNNAWEGTWCNTGNAFLLSGGQALVIPLYGDSLQSQNNVFSGFSAVEYKRLFPLDLRIDFVPIWAQADSFTLGFVWGDEKVTTISQTGTTDGADLFFTNFLLQEYLEDLRTETVNHHLIVSNNQKDTLIQFCLNISISSHTSPHPLPLDHAHIKSIGQFHGKTLGLDAVYRHNVLPSFLSHTSLGF